MKEREREEFQNFYYKIEYPSKSSFCVRCYLSFFKRKIIGEALFYKTTENIWKARVDVRDDDRFRKHGIGTKLLLLGDEHIRKIDPEPIREFEKLGDFGDTYLNQIPNDNLINAEGKRYKFKL